MRVDVAMQERAWARWVTGDAASRASALLREWWLLIAFITLCISNSVLQCSI